MAGAAERAGFKTIVPAPACRPGGFELYEDLVKVREWDGQRVLWYQFTNGMRSYSVFQRPVQPVTPERTDRQSTRTFKVGGFQFTIMGHVQPEELKLIKAGYGAP